MLTVPRRGGWVPGVGWGVAVGLMKAGVSVSFQKEARRQFGATQLRRAGANTSFPCRCQSLTQADLF